MGRHFQAKGGTYFPSTSVPAARRNELRGGLRGRRHITFVPSRRARRTTRGDLAIIPSDVHRDVCSVESERSNSAVCAVRQAVRWPQSDRARLRLHAEPRPLDRERGCCTRHPVSWHHGCCWRPADQAAGSYGGGDDRRLILEESRLRTVMYKVARLFQLGGPQFESRTRHRHGQGSIPCFGAVTELV